MGQKHTDQNLTFRRVMTDAVKAHRAVGGVSSKLFVLARKCQDADHFLAMCQVEEDWVLSDRAGQMQVTELPACWTQAKSDVKTSLKAGVDLNKVTSYHKMKEAKTEINKGKRGKGGGAPVQREAEPAPVTTVEEALATGDVLDAKGVILLPPELMELVKYLDKLPELDRARAVKVCTKVAKDCWDTYCQNTAKGQRDKAKPPVRGSSSIKDKLDAVRASG